MKQPQYNLKTFPKGTFTRECSPTSTGVIEAERTALHIQSQDGNSSAAGDLELLFQNGGGKWRVKCGVTHETKSELQGKKGESLQDN